MANLLCHNMFKNKHTFILEETSQLTQLMYGRHQSRDVFPVLVNHWLGVFPQSIVGNFRFRLPFKNEGLLIALDPSQERVFLLVEGEWKWVVRPQDHDLVWACGMPETVPWVNTAVSTCRQYLETHCSRLPRLRVVTICESRVFSSSSFFFKNLSILISLEVMTEAVSAKMWGTQWPDSLSRL